MSSRECGCWKLLGCHEARHSRLLLMLWPRHQQTMGHNWSRATSCVAWYGLTTRRWLFQKGELLSQSNLRREECPGCGVECLFLIAQNDVKGQSAKPAQSNVSTKWTGEHFHAVVKGSHDSAVGLRSPKPKLAMHCRLPRARPCCTSVKWGSDRKRGRVTSGMALWEDMGEIQGNPKHWVEAVPTLPYWRKLPSACLPHPSRLPNWQVGISSGLESEK